MLFRSRFPAHPLNRSAENEMKTCPVCDTPYPVEHRTCPADGAVLIESRELVPGHLVRGKYRIIRKLGQGGMGTVYLAEHLLLGGQLALKFLAVELSQNPQFVKRFRNEARAAYQLRHPNLVEVVDLDQDEDGSLFIAMEYIPGASVRTILRETKGAIPVPRALQIVRGVGAGLAAAHARGAVHRDIKPENLLLRIEPSGGEIQVKVLDFGIAAMSENITNLSRTHGLLLTPEYAAPEQWRGTPANELDGRTDLYALGGVFYEMLAGRTPFHAVNPEGWMYQHLQCSPEPLAALRPDLPRQYPGLDAVVMRLLAREREDRFPSGNAFLEELERFSGVVHSAVSNPPLEVAGLNHAPDHNLSRFAEIVSTSLNARPDAAPSGELFSALLPNVNSRTKPFVWGGAGILLVLVGLVALFWSNRQSSHDGASGSPLSGSPSPSSLNAPPQPALAESTSNPRKRPEASQNSGKVAYSQEVRSAAAGPSQPSEVATAPGKNTLAPPTGTPVDTLTRLHQKTPPVSPPSRQVNVSAGLAAGMLRQKTVPVYPPIARAARVSGTVVLDATISTSGNIEELRVISGPALLQQAALDAVQTWQYAPYLVNGEPVKVKTTINVIFSLGL